MANKDYLNDLFIEEAKAALSQNGGGGGVSSWNDLTDKPFGEEGRAPIVWDGNAEGKETLAMGEEAFVKISNSPFTLEEARNATVFLFGESGLYANGTVLEPGVGNVSNFYIADLEAVMGCEEGLGYAIAYKPTGSTIPCIFSITSDSVSTMGITFTKGVYFYKKAAFYVASLNFPSQVKPIDEKFLPEPLAYDKTPEPITWDGNTDGLISFQIAPNVTGYRISEKFLPKDGIAGGVGYLSNATTGDVMQSMNVTEDMIQTVVPFGLTDEESWVIMHTLIGSPVVLSLHSDETVTGYGVVPAGLYLLKMMNSYVSKFEYPTNIKPIDPKFINEIILPSSTEGSSKKFKITVDDSGIISATEVTE